MAEEEQAAQTARQRLTAENRAIIERFAREGDQMDMGSIFALRVDVLVDFLMAEGGVMREAYETAFEATLNSRLKDVDKQRTKSKLLDGVMTDLPPQKLRH